MLNFFAIARISVQHSLICRR